MKTCERYQEQLAALALGELSEDPRRELEGHLEACEPCRAELERMRKVLELAGKLKAGAKQAEHWSRAERDLLELVQARPRRWSGCQAACKCAIAAMMLIGVTLTAFYIGGKDVFHAPTYLDTNGSGAAVMQGLEKARKLYEKGDTEGLLVLLKTGMPQVQIAAGEYLGRIGDADTLERLRVEAERWTGPAKQNPFTGPMEAIQRRLEEGP